MEILISKNGKRFGPYSQAQVTGYVKQGHFIGSDLAWHKGIPQWVPLSQVMTLPPSNPSAPPPLPRLHGGFSKAELLEIADGQKALIWLMLALVVTSGFWFIPLVNVGTAAIASHLKGTVWLGLFWLGMFGVRFVATGIFSMILVHRVALATRSPTPVFYALLSLIPFFGLIVVLMVNSDATDILRRRGIRVGLMGASKSDLAKFSPG